MSLVGRHIGRYRILEQLGQGGMSVVYKGLDTSLDREVAVKVLHAHLAGKEESRRRLAREAKAVAKLHHPNILEIYDFAGADTDEAFIVTEYIRGQTLRQYAEGSGFEPPEIAAMVVHEIASALSQAHEAGIIHRDLKPENVMVRDDGVLKLMDFGIAKIIDRDDKMTMTGALVGSPAHMAPEIIEGEEAGAEADVFSLGTMLFYFATGRLPFTAPNTTATLKRILDGIYDDPRQLVPTVSDDLAEIIATCLARQPSSRYANATKLRDALHEYLSALGLGRTTEELQSFFADPHGYRKQLVPRLSQALIARSEAFLAEKRPARALAALNQVLALEPQNTRAVQLLQEMNVARKKQRTSAIWKRAGLGAGAVTVIAVAAVLGVKAAHGQRQGDEIPATEKVQDAPGPRQARAEELPARAEEAPARTEAIEANPEVVQDTTPPRQARDEREPAEREPTAPEKKAPTESHPTHKAQVKLASAEIHTAPPLAAVPVTIKILPFGKFSLDHGAWTDEAPTRTVQLLPGPHTIQYSCRFCETVSETITVSARDKELFFKAPSMPAHLRFDVRPREALVRVLGVQRTAADSLTDPFIVRSRSRPDDLRHQVQYEVFLAGYRGHSGNLVLDPGETRTVTLTLSPE